MKSIQIAELKAHFSQYLREVREGGHITVLDRNEPVAELIPLRSTKSTWERLSQQMGIRLGSQDWNGAVPSRLKKKIPVSKLLREVRGDR